MSKWADFKQERRERREVRKLLSEDNHEFY
jgi:hypothetical protein